MFMKKKEEKNLAWYQDKLNKLNDEIDIVRKGYNSCLTELYYPEFREKIGRYYKSERHYSSNSEFPFYEYHVLLDIQPEDLYTSTDGEVLAYCKTSSISRDADGQIKINLSEINYFHCLGEEINEREYKEAVYGILLEATSLLPNWRMFQ